MKVPIIYQGFHLIVLKQKNVFNHSDTNIFITPIMSASLLTLLSATCTMLKIKTSHSSPLLLKAALCGGFYYYSHFADEETEV